MKQTKRRVRYVVPVRYVTMIQTQPLIWTWVIGLSDLLMNATKERYPINVNVLTRHSRTTTHDKRVDQMITASSSSSSHRLAHLHQYVPQSPQGSTANVHSTPCSTSSSAGQAYQFP
jgi:hypothetical protein